MQKKVIAMFTLLAILTLTFATPARAFDGRTGDQIVISANEVISEDLYVSASEFTLEGTVKGDLVVGAAIIRINGVVEGDLIAGGQTVIINGTVMDDARIAGAVLLVGENAMIGGDLIGMGASLETRPGSSVGNDLVAGSGQVLLAGQIARDVLAGTSGLELRGSVGGNIKAMVEESGTQTGAPYMFMPQSGVDVPSVRSGLKIADSASIGGDLEYTQSRDLSIPASAVLGSIKRINRITEEITVQPKSTSQKVIDWSLNLLRSILSLIVVGLLLAWLFPALVSTAADRLQARPIPSFGWGLVSLAAAIFAVLLIFVTMIVLAVFFGILTLGDLVGTTIFLGILALVSLVVGFTLLITFVSKIVVAYLGGRWVLSRTRPEWTQHKVWPLLIGVVLFAVLVAIPWVGGLISLVVVLLGLGALWLIGSESFMKKAPA